MKTSCQLIILAFTCGIFFSCKKILGVPSCEQPQYITNSAIQVIFKDSVTNKYLYSTTSPTYNKDSIKIYNPQGDELSLLMSESYDSNAFDWFLEINFGSLFDGGTDSISFSREICKDFVVQYSYNEKDTITTCFKSKDEKCGSVFTTLKVYYKGRLLASEANTTGALVTVIKN